LPPRFSLRSRYLAIGIAFGLMLQEISYNFIWAFFMSLTFYDGSGQYLWV
jgi:predicted branched-subunit amino acid permease